MTIVDDDMPVVSIVATDNVATETGTTTGTFTVSRTGPTTSALTVNFTVAGSATSGSDYTSIGTSVSIPAGSSSKTITLTPVNDTTSEGDEYVLVTLSTSSSYTLGTPYFDSITIEDDDFAPYVQITSPVYPNIVLPSGTGLVLEALATDDGLPSPMTYSWTKVSGPGTVTFGTPAALNTTALFSANGTYVVRFRLRWQPDLHCRPDRERGRFRYALCEGHRHQRERGDLFAERSDRRPHPGLPQRGHLEQCGLLPLCLRARARGCDGDGAGALGDEHLRVGEAGRDGP
ncbi:MAG: Calx-beta domain-containing protein [Luteolibacter sp.]